jgi:hypothetical protein
MMLNILGSVARMSELHRFGHLTPQLKAFRSVLVLCLSFLAQTLS